MNEKSKIKPPAVTPETEPFWKATAEGRFLIKHCKACGENHYYPRPLCPFCLSADTEWLEASGKGTIYSYTVLRRAPVVTAPAYVTLEEGPIVLAAFIDGDFDALRIGQPVQVTFAATDGGPPIPVFTPR